MITIPTGSENIFNVCLIIFYIVFVIGSYRKGFFRAIVALLGGLLSLFLAYRYCSLAAQYFHIWPSGWTPFQDTLISSTVYDYINETAWFIIIFLVLKLIFYILEKLMAGIQSVPVLRQISGILGAVLGFCSATIWIMVICVLLATPLFSGGNEIVKNSYLGLVENRTNAALAQIGVMSNSDMINQIYTAAQKLDDKDKTAVEKWLEEQGYEKLTTGTEEQFSSKSSVDPSADSSALPSAEPSGKES
ncbi:MAG: CvpA family protein [Erysipelotrichia bacterium]|nr:CvpA family protein [Erysipelotrichia bacterium]